MIAKKGQWVQIRNEILQPEGRASQVPDDTKKTPLIMWVKGHLLNDCAVGQVCKITTVTGRTASGILEEIEPGYTHDYGAFVPELDIIHRQVKDKLGV